MAYPGELLGVHHLTMTTYKQDGSVPQQKEDSLLSGTFQTIEELIAT